MEQVTLKNNHKKKSSKMPKNDWPDKNIYKICFIKKYCMALQGLV